MLPTALGGPRDLRGELVDVNLLEYLHSYWKPLRSPEFGGVEALGDWDFLIPLTTYLQLGPCSLQCWN